MQKKIARNGEKRRKTSFCVDWLKGIEADDDSQKKRTVLLLWSSTNPEFLKNEQIFDHPPCLHADGDYFIVCVATHTNSRTNTRATTQENHRREYTKEYEWISRPESNEISKRRDSSFILFSFSFFNLFLFRFIYRSFSVRGRCSLLGCCHIQTNNFLFRFWFFISSWNDETGVRTSEQSRQRGFFFFKTFFFNFSFFFILSKP